MKALGALKPNMAIKTISGMVFLEICVKTVHFTSIIHFYVQSFHMTEYFSPERALSVRVSVCLSQPFI